MTQAHAIPLAASTDGVEIEVIQSLKEMESIRPFWLQHVQDLESEPDFYSIIATVRPEVVGPFVIVARSQGTPSALLIGRLEDQSLPLALGYWTFFRLRLRQLVFIRDGYLNTSATDLSPRLVREVLHHLRKGVAHRAVFANLPLGAALAQSVSQAASCWQRDRVIETVPHWHLSLPSSVEDFIGQRPRKHRYELRRLARQLESDHRGTVDYRVFSNTSEIEEFCRLADQVARKTYQRQLAVGFMNSEEDRRRMELFALQGWWRAYLLLVGGKPIAFWSGAIYRGIMRLTWTGYDPGYHRYEPGTLVLLKMIDDLCRRNVKEIDFGIGEAPYKERFSDRRDEEMYVTVYAFNAKAFLVNFAITFTVWLNRLGKRLLGEKVSRIKRWWRNVLVGEATTQPQPK